MKISELKSEVQKYDKKDLIKIIGELYKRIPKAKKEEYDIDEFIKNVSIEKRNKKEEKEISFEELSDDINIFLSCVDDDLYSSPNKIISKKDRSNWRFVVKRYYKELNKINYDSPYYNEATMLLIEIFRRLSEGTTYLLFTNWNTFEALGVHQDDYYEVLIKRILYNGCSLENLRICIDLLCVDKSGNYCKRDMYKVLEEYISDINSKYDTIKLITEKNDGVMKTVKGNYIDDYYLREDINDLVKMAFDIYVSMEEYSKGVKYFKKNYVERDKEFVMYNFLEHIEEMKLYDLWIEVYEEELGNVDYRDSLKAKYKELKSK